MFIKRSLFLLASTAVLGAGCARYTQAAEGGDLPDPAEAAKTVVLQAENLGNQSMELRTVLNGMSHFVGSVSSHDVANILLDASIFPTGFLYVVAIPADGRGRAVVGPLSATRGDKIRFTIQPTLASSRAIVIH